MNKVIVGIGIPGSGKTTVLRKFAEKYAYVYLCPDDIRKELTGSEADQSKNSAVWSEALRRLAEEIKEGKTVVFDATFANFEQRREFLKFARDNGAEKIQGVYLDTPLETAKERNRIRERKVPEHALERMDKKLHEFPPTIADGFDSVFTLNEKQEFIEGEKEGEEGITYKEFKRHR
jgi:predicted kinase